MIFNSIEFIPFFLIVYALYLAAHTRTLQNIVLVVASYVFLGYAAPAYAYLLAFYTVVAFLAALAIERAGQWRRAVLAVAVAINLGVLAYYKYADFFIAQVTAGLVAMGMTSPLRSLNVVLPIGVSFFTFQCIAYIVDVSRGDIRATRNLLDFAVFKSFFPQLVAGPIERGRHMLPQFAQRRIVRAADLRDGLYLVLLGYVLKCVIADRLGSFVDYQFLPLESVDRTPERALLAVVAFGIQIYGDFAGYTYIALGLARLMGVELSRNFLAPYLACDIREFWRRWHVTLSSWLRDYLYIPLGGSKHGEVRTSLSLMLTMALGGLWHGASWTFIIWGVFHGAGLVLHRLTAPWREQWPMPVRIYGGWLLTIGFVMTGWAIFRARSLADLSYLLNLIGQVNPATLVMEPLTWILAAIFGLVVVIQYAEETRVDATLVTRLPIGPRVAVYVAGLASILAVGFGSYRFIYFQF